jgi:hypothetical protein
MNFHNATPIGFKAGPAYFEKTPPLVEKIRASSGVVTSSQPATALNESELSNGLFRVYTRPEGLQGTNPFGFNRAMLHQTFLLEGFEPLDMRRHRNLINVMSKRNIENLLKITNVRYVTTLRQWDEEIQTFGDAMPRAYIVPNARFFADDDTLLEELTTFNPKVEVLISGDGRYVNQPQTPGMWQAAVTEYNGSTVSINAESDKDGYLVLSDSAYPGWRAWVDGAEVPVLRANYNFRAVSLARGQHKLVFKYMPTYLMTGALISLLTAAVSLLVLLWPVIAGRVSRKNSGRQSEA